MSAGIADSLGVECEYAILEDGRNVDFRRLVESVAAASPARLLREQELRYRFVRGHLLTCDGWYAELATPPEPISAQAPSLVAGQVAQSRNWLLDALGRVGERYCLTGHSTHLNVSLPPGAQVQALTNRFALAYGPLLLFLTSVPNTTGIVCRPRPGRLEIVTEFIEDPDRLRAALGLAVAGVRALLAGERATPLLLDEALSPAPSRYGWHLITDRLSAELRARRRDAPVMTTEGTLPLQTLLEREWQSLLPHFRAALSVADAALVEEYLAGARPAGIELPPGDPPLSRLPDAHGEPAGEQRFAGALTREQLPDGWSIDPAFIDWSFVAFRARKGGEERFFTIPHRLLAAFAGADVDPWLVSALRGRATGLLANAANAEEPRVFGALDEAALADTLERQPAKKKKKKPPKRRKKCHAGVRLLRLGPYPPALAEHLTRPFYRRRTLEEQEGADLFIYPIGKPDLGKHVHFLVEVAPELTMDAQLTIRIYTKPDLSEFTDYVGPPEVTVSGNLAEVDITSEKTIYFVHILRQRYSGLLTLPGHAVEVNVTILPTSPDDDRCEHRWVNLLLYEHDLGHAPGCALTAPLRGSDILDANLSNGNIHYTIPLFQWEGRGMSLGCGLHFNSFYAAQMEAVERMGRINQVPPEELWWEYARCPMGYGWMHTYGIYVVDYVLSEMGQDVRKRLEHVALDGNHIQFEATEKLNDTFKPVGRGTLFDGDPISGGSLVIETQRDSKGAVSGYEMTDLHQDRWKFDALGQITEIATMASVRSQGALAPTRIDYPQGKLVVTDTVGRTLTAELVGHRVQSFSDQGNRSWKLGTADPRLLDSITWPDRPGAGVERHELRYDPVWHFLSSVTNRRLAVTKLIHVLDDTDAWGRLDSVARPSMGSRWSVEYLPVQPVQRSKALVTDARGTLWRYEWERDSLALLTLLARRKQVNEPDVILVEGWIKHTDAQYYSEGALGSGKLASRSVDLHGFVHETIWESTLDGRGYLARETRIGGRRLYAYTWDPGTNQVHTTTDANGYLTTNEYDAYGNVRSVQYPTLTKSPGGPAIHIETWRYAADGKLQRHRDREGRLTTYAYGGAGDPFGTGRATSETLAGATWTYSYARSGKLKSITEPFNGGTSEYDYDVLDRKEKIRLPEGGVVTGTDETTKTTSREEMVFEYDENGNISDKQIPLGGDESFTYNDDDLCHFHADSDGTEENVEYDHYGELLLRTDRRGRDWTFERDYLGRELKILHPATQAGVLVERMIHPDDHSGNVLLYAMGPLAHGTVGYPRREARTELDWQGQLKRRVRWTKTKATDHTPVETEWIYERDDYGHLKSVTLKHAGRECIRETYTLDEWYRVTAVTVGSATTEYELGPFGQILSVKTPDHGRGQRALWKFGYDEHHRETTLSDPYGVVIRDIKYLPGRKEYHGIRIDGPVPNPSVHRGGDTTLTLLKTETIDGRGLITRIEMTNGPTTSLYYNQRGMLVVSDDGETRAAYELDGHGRRTSATVRDRVSTKTTTQRFDEVGNLTFLSGTDFDSNYEYDARDLMTSETRDPKNGGASSTFRTIEYDVFGRPLVRTTEGGLTTEVHYDDAGLRLWYNTRGPGVGYYGAVTYHWNGEIAHYTRIRYRNPGTWNEENEVSYTVSSDAPDSMGRIKKITSEYHYYVPGYSGSVAILGELEYELNPAGTRKSMTVRWGGSQGMTSELRREYEYHPDWQLKELKIPGGGSYQFRYQPSGGLSSWTSPRGHESQLAYSREGVVKRLESWRNGSADPFLRARTDFHPPGQPNAGKEETSSVDFFHSQHDGSSGFWSSVAGHFVGPNPRTNYSSKIEYDSRGRPWAVNRNRDEGQGIDLERRVTTSYNPDGSVYAVSEHHQFPSSHLHGFYLERLYKKSGLVHSTENTLSGTLEDLLLSTYWNTQTSERDPWGRIRKLTLDSLVSPDTFWNQLFPSQSWTRYEQAIERDELGRVSYVRSSSATRADDPAAVWSPNPGYTQAFLLHDGKSRVAGRTDRTYQVIPHTSGVLADPTAEVRLYLYDGADIVAEIGRRVGYQGHTTAAHLVRYYEHGPGSDFRLAVIHDREIQGVSATRTDEYLYGPGLVSVGLAGESNDGGGNASSVVRRFPLWELALPGDTRYERMKADQTEDEILIAANSPLFIPGATPARGGLPAELSNLAVSAIGSGLARPPTDESLAVLLPHSSLFEDVHEPEAQLIDIGELKQLPYTDWVDTAVDWVFKHTPIVNAIYRLNMSIALVKAGAWDQAHAEVEGAAQDLADLVLAGSGVLGIGGLEAELENYWVKTAYDCAKWLIENRQIVTALAGTDPNTGKSIRWNERLSICGETLSPQLLSGIPYVFSGYGCFPAATQVHVPDGATRAIEALERDDLVLGFSRAGRATPRKVLALHRHWAPVMTITHAGGQLRTSETQPFLTDRGWVDGAELRVGDRLLAAEGESYAVTELAKLGIEQEVYNLSIEADETYLVGEHRLVVHNKPENIAERVSKLRMMKAALSATVEWTVAKQTARTRILTAVVQVPGNRGGPVRLYKVQTWPKDTYTAVEHAEFLTKGARFAAGAPHLRSAWVLKTERKSTTASLRRALQLQNGWTSQQLSAALAGKHVDHGYELRAGGHDVPSSTDLLDSHSVSAAKLGVKLNYGLAPLSPSVNCSWGAIVNHTHKYMSRQTDVISSGFVGIETLPHRP
jgi:hypothetical protein